MLTYSLEKDGGESLYTQLYACIRRDILSAPCRPGRSCPPSGLWPSTWRSASSP